MNKENLVKRRQGGKNGRTGSISLQIAGDVAEEERRPGDGAAATIGKGDYRGSAATGEG